MLSDVISTLLLIAGALFFFAGTLGLLRLPDVYSRLQRADGPVLEQGAVSCCYAKSEKAWISDPQGVKWETFLTTGESTTYGGDAAASPPSTCCAPKAA